MLVRELQDIDTVVQSLTDNPGVNEALLSGRDDQGFDPICESVVLACGNHMQV